MKTEGKTKRKIKYCPYCDRMVRPTKRHINHILHLLLSIFTLGLWAPIWFILGVRSLNRPYHCPICRLTELKTVEESLEQHKPRAEVLDALEEREKKEEKQKIKTRKQWIYSIIGSAILLGLVIYGRSMIKPELAKYRWWEYGKKSPSGAAEHHLTVTVLDKKGRLSRGAAVFFEASNKSCLISESLLGVASGIELPAFAVTTLTIEDLKKILKAAELFYLDEESLRDKLSNWSEPIKTEEWINAKTTKYGRAEFMYTKKYWICFVLYKDKVFAAYGSRSVPTITVTFEENGVSKDKEPKNKNSQIRNAPTILIFSHESSKVAMAERFQKCSSGMKRKSLAGVG